MAAAIAFVLGNFTLSFLVVGLIAAIVSLLRARNMSTAHVVEALLFYFQ